jgi:hypothetical protein
VRKKQEIRANHTAATVPDMFHVKHKPQPIELKTIFQRPRRARRDATHRANR